MKRNRTRGRLFASVFFSPALRWASTQRARELSLGGERGGRGAVPSTSFLFSCAGGASRPVQLEPLTRRQSPCVAPGTAQWVTVFIRSKGNPSRSVVVRRVGVGFSGFRVEMEKARPIGVLSPLNRCVSASERTGRLGRSSALLFHFNARPFVRLLIALTFDPIRNSLKIRTVSRLSARHFSRPKETRGIRF